MIRVAGRNAKVVLDAQDTKMGLTRRIFFDLWEKMIRRM